MAVIANRKVDLLPGWSFLPGQRVPEKLWNDLGKAKQRVLLGGRFFMVKHGKAAERVPAAEYNPATAVVPPVPAPAAPRKIVVWPEYERPVDTTPSLRELAGMERKPYQPDGPFVCSECGASVGSKQALGGHKAGHTRERRRQLQTA